MSNINANAPGDNEPVEIELNLLDLNEQLAKLSKLLSELKVPTVQKERILELTTNILDEVDDSAYDDGYTEGFLDGQSALPRAASTV